MIGLAVAIGLILWLALRDTGGSSASTSATAVSIEQIASLASSVDHPVFWVGPRAGYTYELTRSANGAIFIRYLPQGVDVGASEPYLTVATYPFAGAFPALQAVAKQSGSTPVKISNAGIAESSRSTRTRKASTSPIRASTIRSRSTTLHPAAASAAARQLAAFGSLAAGPATPSSKPAAASVADLKSLASTLGHPVYWIGPEGRLHVRADADAEREDLHPLPSPRGEGRRGAAVPDASPPTRSRERSRRSRRWQSRRTR